MAIFCILLVFALGLYWNNKFSRLKNELENLNFKIKYLEDVIEKEKPIIKPEVIEENILINDHNIAPIIKKAITNSAQLEEHKIPQPNIERSNELFGRLLNKALLFIQDNFLTIIGIVTLVLGIGYFVKYAIDQNWINEVLRVSIGIAIGAGIIVAGHYLRNKYEVFSSILIGGGISILYFTLTIAFREYLLFNQNFAFILLAFVTLISIILSFIYNQQVLFIFSLLGGFAAPLMISTGESNYMFLFSYLFILNLGTLFIIFKKNWEYPGVLSFILSILFFNTWAFDPTDKVIFIFLFLYYIVFIAFSILPLVKARNFTLTHQILYIINTLSFTILGLYTYQHYYTDFISLTPFILAGCSLIIFFIYKNTNQQLSNTSIALGIGLITLGIGIEFKANIVTSLWAIQSTMLLFLWKRSNNPIFKGAFIALTPFFIISLIINWAKYITDQQVYPIIINPIFITSGLVVICSIANIFLIKSFNKEEKFAGFKINNAKNLFSLVSILFIYFGILFELMYQTDKYYTYNIIIGILILYSIYFSCIILYFSRLFNINHSTKFALGIISLVLISIYPLAVMIVDEIIFNSVSYYSYIFYLLYLIPFIYLILLYIKSDEFKLDKKNNFSQGLICASCIYIVCFEVHNLFMIITNEKQNVPLYLKNEEIFFLILLPILWAILGFTTIYFGINKRIKNLIYIGFILFVLIILKLYLVDVWQMSNVFRIISFIILGILILITSFMYQKWKKVVNNIFDAKIDIKKADS